MSSVYMILLSVWVCVVQLQEDLEYVFLSCDGFIFQNLWNWVFISNMVLQIRYFCNLHLNIQLVIRNERKKTFKNPK